MSRKKNILLILITFTFTVLLALVSGEALVRLFAEHHDIPAPPPPRSLNPYKPNNFIVNMRPYLYFHIPQSKYTQKLRLYDNEYKINSMGFRGNDFEIKSHDNKRLAVIGDSIVEGHGVQPDQIFTYHLEEKLSKSGWEVINLGVQGASPLYYAANLERYLYQNPDAVLLLINENDLREDDHWERAYFNLPFLERREILFSGDTVHSWYGKSRLISFLGATFQALSKTPLETIVEKNLKINTIAERDAISHNKTSSFVFAESKIDQRWEMSQEYLTYFLENLQSRNIDLLVSSLCTVTLAYPEKKAYTTYCSNLENRVKQWAGQHNVPYLSLVPQMKKALDDYKRNEVLIFQDMHPTPLTHRLLAEEVYPFIADRLTGKTSSTQTTD